NPVRRIGDFMTEALRTNLNVAAADAGKRAVAMLDQVGIGHGERRLRQYPHELSGGLLQRVMIAAALLTEPQLLLADEPTTALDVTTQAEVMAILDELRRDRGLALLFITHDLDLADAVCDRTCVMYAGQIVEDQPAAALAETPLHPYTRSLEGARPAITGPAQRLAAIRGRPVSAFEAPAGCARSTARWSPSTESIWPSRPAGRWPSSGSRARARRRWRACWWGWPSRPRARSSPAVATGRCRRARPPSAGGAGPRCR